MKFKYDVAVSFAGEDRAVVEEFVNILAANNISVFYDLWEQAQLWGKDLYQHLDMIYRQAAQYCVIFVSQNYVQKAWTKHELRSAQARAFQQNAEYILPVRLDDTELPGLPGTVCYIDLRGSSVKEVASLLVEKVASSRVPNLQELRDKAKSADAAERLFALSQVAVFQVKDFLDVAIDLLLNDPLPEVRERAAWALDNLNDEHAVPALVRAIYDSAFGVRSAAGWGLVHLGDKVVPLMREVIARNDDPVAIQMANLVLDNL